MPPRRNARSETADTARTQVTTAFTVRFPDHESDLDQDTEWCFVETDGELRRVRFHDYEAIFAVPGLYEYLFHEKLECVSPKVVRELLGDVLEKKNLEPDSLTVLDVGAGNGMVGEELVGLGVRSVVGVDILPEAASAVERDRPGVYDAYRVVDLTKLTPEEDRFLAAAGFTGMTTVAALGFGDIPPAAFAQAFNYVAPNGLVAFNIRDRFVSEADSSGFSRLIRRMVDAGLIERLVERRYQHRLDVTGEPLYYVAYVAEKRADIPVAWVARPTAPTH